MLIRENTVWALSRMFFLEFLKNFQNSYVKEQMCFHAVGALKEMDGLLKDLIRNALSLECFKFSCQFKPFEFLLRCSIWSSDTKITSKLVLLLLSTWYVWITHSSSQQVITLLDIFSFITDVKLLRERFLSPVLKNATKMCVCVCMKDFT